MSFSKMGNTQTVVQASTAHEDEQSQTDKREAKGEKRIWAEHMYTVRDSCNLFDTNCKFTTTL